MTLDDLEKTLAAMTAGPWRASTDQSDDVVIWAGRGKPGAWVGNVGDWSKRDGTEETAQIMDGVDADDAAGIATLRNIAAELIAVARAANDMLTCHERDDYPNAVLGLGRARAALDAALAPLAPPKAGD